ncbi:ATP-binding protein [Pseudomonas sp. NPDC007930]|uniref:ATP-binding protein n=1 Tax=Pseudomonas sp. NPDC007930 TaxID=3364417 RepID=UPI0036E5FB77
MSLRLRLSLVLGGGFILIWVLASAWMFRDLRNQMMFSLDQRLVASARMVAGLLDQLPAPQEGTARYPASQLTIPEGMACKISSLRGEVIARSHTGAEDDLVDHSGFHDQTLDGEAWRTYTLDRGDVRITTADRRQEREALNSSILLAASAPVIVALFGSLGMLWLGLGRGLASLNRIRDALLRRSPDSLEPLAVERLPRELQPLLDSQNQLFLRIGRTLERERRLTGDAAHELRSPLTAIKTHLQVARMTTAGAQEQALEHAEQATDRLHRTLEQLLLLARVEGSLSFDDGVQMSTEQVARMAIGDACAGDRERIALVLAEPLASQPLALPSVLAVAALRNLLDNALRHSPAGAPVSLALRTQGGQALFQVRDHGPGIAAENLEHLTERFWRSSGSAGCGLGLAIVQAIVQRCGGQLHFDSQADGLRVVLRLPLQGAGLGADQRH